VASITYEENNDYNRKTYDNAIHYSYDIEGNIASMMIDVPHDSIVKQRYKRLNYYYDLISGNINELIYQQDSIDQFIHSYEYDADGSLTDVLTSRDSLYWEHDAGYEYYDHGSLARTVLGRRQVQGIDYTYTLNGWIKGVNSSINNPSYDMGHDGDIHNTNNTVARDAYGFTLSYFNGDYRSIAASSFEAVGLPTTSLYNGNIASATYSIKPLAPNTIGYTYVYDQLNRVVSEKAFKGIDTVHNLWAAGDSINDFREKVNYDENGNILMYLRHGNSAVGPTQMDSLTYHYTKGKNQLAQINDAVSSTNYPVDIDNETSERNYQYNKLGELAKDSAGGLDTITWTIYGKIKKIKKYTGDSIIFFYDPMSDRLEKRYYHSTTSDTTKYIKDVQKNILAIYDRKKDTVRLTEWDIYGAKRVGSVDTILRMQKPNIGVGTVDSLTINYLEGQKQYELNNHLGNVLATISDKKIPVDTVITDTLAKYYLPLIINAQDYYPYGMEEPGRTYLLNGDSSYRYAFNGKEKTNEIYGKADAYDYGARMYDPRVGRFFSIDPWTDRYPSQSPYVYINDNPIALVDFNGMGDGPGKEVKLSGNSADVWGASSSNSSIAVPENPSLTKIDNKGCLSIDPNLVKRVFPKASDSRIQQFTAALNDFLDKMNITDIKFVEHFLGQVGAETGGLTTSTFAEGMDYTDAGRIKTTFSSFFEDKIDPKTGAILRKSLYNSKDYVDQPKKLGDLVYEGYNNRGFGVIQITGKDTHKKFIDWYKKTYGSEPNLNDIATDVNIATLSGLWYFKTFVADKLNIDKAKVKDVTKKVNKALKAEDERVKYYNTAVDVFSPKL